MKKGDPKGLGDYACSSPGGCGGPPAFNPDKSTYDLGKCGSFTYSNPTATKRDNVDPGCTVANSMQCYASKAQVTALQEIIPTLAGIAQQLVNADYSYRDFYAHSSNVDSSSSSSDWGWIYKYLLPLAYLKKLAGRLWFYRSLQGSARRQEYACRK